MFCIGYSSHYVHSSLLVKYRTYFVLCCRSVWYSIPCFSLMLGDIGLHVVCKSLATVWEPNTLYIYIMVPAHLGDPAAILISCYCLSDGHYSQFVCLFVADVRDRIFRYISFAIYDCNMWFSTYSTIPVVVSNCYTRLSVHNSCDCYTRLSMHNSRDCCTRLNVHNSCDCYTRLSVYNSYDCYTRLSVHNSYYCCKRPNVHNSCDCYTRLSVHNSCEFIQG